MARINYTAILNGETVTRAFHKPLTHAYRITFVLASAPDAEPAVKSGFSGSEELAAKATKLGKRFVVKSCEIVKAKAGAEVASKAKPKAAKKVKPFTVGEAVTVEGATGTVEKVGRLYVYIMFAGFKAAKKFAFADVAKMEVVAPSENQTALAA